MEKVDVMRTSSRLLHPRPAVIVTCLDKEGHVNAIAISWITPVSKKPPMVAICVAKTRYSHQLIREAGEFVVNVPSAELAGAVHYCGTVSGRDVKDKPLRTGLTLKPARVVKTPIIDECVAHLECVLKQVVDGGWSHDIFVGEVVAAYARPDAFRGETGLWNLEVARPLLHAGGNVYSRPEPSFKVERKA